MCTGGLLITSRSLAWFVVTMVASMTLLSAIVQPKWLIGPEEIRILNEEGNFTVVRHPSVGIYNRCKRMGHEQYNCGNFDLYGLMTDSSVFPVPWKCTMFLMCVGTMLLGLTGFAMLVICCRVHSFFGFSMHKYLCIFQAIAAMMVLCGYLVYPLAWDVPRVRKLCGPDAEPYSPADCTLGSSIYLGAVGVLLAFLCTVLSMKAEASYYSAKAQRRVIDGDVLVCVM
ncbi:LHFPL tetraspan subfamily member 2a protein [Anopheles maculipalpis]|uniref:LHFPL tetraspan subfamily member 2a protein n=1 Tax=Anopheles maculipalpis TaxID=1496333 RepID=UPI002158DAD9|nr:LHFPL tetraspan subfamily member 2a protein [Anopheles maculipalpis]